VELGLGVSPTRAEVKIQQTELHPVLEEFKQLIETDPVVGMYVHEIID
jgi:hypothetical protein